MGDVVLKTILKVIIFFIIASIIHNGNYCNQLNHITKQLESDEKYNSYCNLYCWARGNN